MIRERFWLEEKLFRLLKVGLFWSVCAGLSSQGLN